MRALSLIMLLPFAAAASPNHKPIPKLYQVESARYQILYFSNNAIYFFTAENLAKENKVKTVSMYELNRKNEKKITETKTYNPAGSVIKRVSENVTTNYSYINDTLISSIERITKKGKYLTTYTYDDQFRVTKYVSSENGKPIYQYDFRYFKDKEVASTKYTTFGKQNHVYEMITEYDDLLNTKTDASYLVDGEVRKTWNYTCDDKGTLVDTKKIEHVTECKNRESNPDGSYSVFTRTVEKGKNYLVRVDYTKDSLYSGHFKYYNDSVLIERSTHENNVSIYETFSEKGKLKYTSNVRYDEHKNIVEQTYSNGKGKIYSHYVSSYNGTLIQSVVRDKGKGTFFEYAFY